MTATDCALAVIAQLLAEGVTEIVLAPGSRSAPLALAAARAEATGRARLHVRSDERSAGFLALGLGKASGVPAVVITTSGTAVGNLLPAVMEAAHSAIPLIVLSADRPAALVGFGANQTTEQSDLFGGFVRYRARTSSAAPPESWSAQAARGFHRAVGKVSRQPGPVQLNLELSEPLVADEPAWPALRPRRSGAETLPSPVPIGPDRRTLVLCGDAPVPVGRAVAAMAEDARLPLIAEPSSNARIGNALQCGRLLLDTALAYDIERVLVFGHPTLSRSVNRMLARDDVEVVVVSEGPEPVDPGWRASAFLGVVEVAPGDPDWLARWRSADADHGRRIAGAIADGGSSGLGLAGAVVSSVGDGVLVLGSSNPIRDADLAPVASRRARVFANRGLAGIDGTISTAIGIALALDSPTTLLCGDLTFLHDCNGLTAGLGERRPDLRIVVADDGGGSIFGSLEYGEERYAPVFERVFATPSGVDLVALVAAHGLPVVRLDNLADVRVALSAPIEGLQVIVVSVDRQGRRALERRLG